MKQVAIANGDGWFTVLTCRQCQDLARRNRGEYEYAKRRLRRNWWRSNAAFTSQQGAPNRTNRTNGFSKGNTDISALGNGKMRNRHLSTHNSRQKYKGQTKFFITPDIQAPLTAWDRVKGLFPYFSQPKQSPLINAIRSINGSSSPNLTTNTTKPHNSNYTSINPSLPKTYNNSSLVMTRKRSIPIPTTQPSIQNSSPLNPNAQSYAHITTPPPNIQLPPYPPTVQRYQSPPWQHYLDQNP